MKKKLLLFVLIIISVIACAFGLVACGDKTDGGNVGESGGNQGTQKPDDSPKEEYIITYDANGGKFADGATTLTQKAKEGDTLTAPSSPARTASAFGGWATEKGGKTLWKFATDTVTKNITLYAVWEEQSAAIISVDGASIDEKQMSVFMLVNKNTESVSLSNKVVCSADSVWKLYYDKLGQTEIPTKIAASKMGELDDGDNIFYIVVTSSGGSQVNVYELTIHRSYAIAVSYYDGKDKLITTFTAYTGDECNITYVPDIDGYTFNYWKDENGKKVTSVTPFESVKLYADCTVNDYTATLDVNGGKALSENTKTVTYDKSFSFPAVTRTGYTFTGWYCDGTQITDANGESLANWTYANDETITAGWQANRYSVTATVNDKDAGTVKVYDRSGSASSDGKYNYNSEVKIEATTNSGYTFLGIYDKSGNKVNEDNKLYYVTTLGEEEESYTAKWIVCPVTVEANLSSAGSISYDKKTVAGANYTLNATTNNGYTWLGWYDGETEITKELSYAFVMPSSSENAVTYTAKWMVCPVTVEKNIDNAGTIEYDVSKTVIGNEYSLSVKDAKLGYIWLGWFNGETKLTEELNYTFTMTADEATYIAKWELDKRLAGFNFTSTQTSLTITGIKNKTVTEIEVPDSVTSIDNYAFRDCSSLTRITIPDSVTSIGYSAFYGCNSLTGIVIPDSVTDIHTSNIFSGCKNLKSVKLPVGLKHIYNSAFKGCGELTDIDIPDGVESIGYEAFMNCYSLTSIKIPESVTSIAYNVFKGCSNLKSVTLTYGVTSIGNNAFEDCYSLTDITIPRSVISIGAQVFKNCTALFDIVIPDSVTSVGSSVFEGCNYIVVYCEASGALDEWNVWWDYSYLRLTVVWNCKNNDKDENGYAYATISGIRYRLKDGNATVIRQSINISGEIVIPASVNYKESVYAVTSFGAEDFKDCVSLISIVIPDSVTSIGYCAFYGCSGLTSITFNGTKEQWNAIEKDSGWSYNTGEYTIHCTDGDISKE